MQTGDKVGFSERVAQYVAMEIMKRTGWRPQPELFQNEHPRCLSFKPKESAQYLVTFPLWKDRSRKFQVIVQLQSMENVPIWIGGMVFAFHHDVHETHWGTAFFIDFGEDGPTIELNELTPIGSEQARETIVFGEWREID